MTVQFDTGRTFELRARNRERYREWLLRLDDYRVGIVRPQWLDWRRPADRLSYMIAMRRRVRPAFRPEPRPPEAA